MPTNSSHRPRLEGLDLARFLAFFGMVIVNFTVVLVPQDADAGAISKLLEGKAAASFVMLAGIGLGLGASSSSPFSALTVTAKRALFLLILGLVNITIFDADILHYYAFYFFFAALLLSQSARVLWAAIVAVNAIFVSLLFVLDYDRGWNWETLEYADFWSPSGFVRNLFFNGWHPVLPWLGFMLLGVILSRFDLSLRGVQIRMVAIGGLVLLGTEVLSKLLVNATLHQDPVLAELLSTSPVPPMPFYTLAGSGAALVLVGVCLLSAPALQRFGLMQIFGPAGRQTLTLYIAHILVGMGTLEALGMLDQPGSPQGAYVASVIFVACATIYAWIWSKVFKRGPIEALMRKIAG